MSTPRPGLIPCFRLIAKMEEPAIPLPELAAQCEAQRERIRKLFEAGATAQDTLRELCELADDAIKKVFWDLGFRVSSAGRTLEECRRVEQNNAEFHLALLDRRFLDGDKTLFEKLDS